MISKYTSHVRSNSLPSKSNNTLINSSVVDILVNKLSTLEVECSSSSSSSVSSICQKLCNVKSIYQGLENSIQLPSNQQALEHHQAVVGEILEGLLILLDMCAFINDVLSAMKVSIFELESCIRRKNSRKEYISAYLMSRKKIHKIINKYLKNLKPLKYDKSYTCIDMVTMLLKEAEKVSLITMKCVLGYLSRSKCKQSGWSLMAKLKNSKNDFNELEKIDQIIYGLESKKTNIDVKIAKDLSKQLASQELAIFEFEECLGAISRCLLKTRVSLLNILSH